VREVLSRTLGVPIFQEQAMQLAIVAAGFTPGEADRLRRAMAAWRRKGGLEPFRERLLAGMRNRGYADEFAEALYRQIQGFGEYGFPESHAASFALLVYVSAWLKRHEPAAFLLGLLNAQPMGFYSPAQLVQDARRHGVEVRPVDVTASAADSTLEGDGPAAVRLGLDRVRNLAAAAGARIVAARAATPFADLADLARRAELGRGDLDTLAAAGALSRLAGHRRQAAWAAAAVPLQRDLFAGVTLREEGIIFAAPREGAEIAADYRSLGLTLGRHPLALLRARLAAQRYLPAMELRAAAIGPWCAARGSSPAASGRAPPAASSSSRWRTKPAAPTWWCSMNWRVASADFCSAAGYWASPASCRWKARASMPWCTWSPSACSTTANCSAAWSRRAGIFSDPTRR
jgi:error-prone DNA polymerase